MEIKIKLNLARESGKRSNIPFRTMREIARGIPPTTGFSRTRQVRPIKPVGRKVQRAPFQIKVEEDTAFNEEFQLIPELTSVLKECLVAFPEVKDIEIRATRSRELSGCKGTHNGKPIIILFTPDQAWGQWNTLKPIVYQVRIVKRQKRYSLREPTKKVKKYGAN